MLHRKKWGVFFFAVYFNANGVWFKSKVKIKNFISVTKYVDYYDDNDSDELTNQLIMLKG